MAAPAASVRAEDIRRRIGDTNEQALAYVLDPDPRLSRLSRKVREDVIADLPPVTAGALLGPAALARHLVASAASGRYRDLFALWELFRHRSGDCRPVLAERQKALEKARAAFATAVRLGLSGHAERVAEDIARAEGLIWQWLRETLMAELEAVGRRPVIASALSQREPDLDIPLPDRPDDRWLAEAADARRAGTIAPAVEAVLAANADRLPATIATLSLARDHYPERLPELVSRIDLDDPAIGALLAWARDHGLRDRAVARVRDAVGDAAAASRAEGLAVWYAWRERGVEVDLPGPLRQPTLDGLDVSRPETAVLAGQLIAEGAPLAMQQVVEELATRNRQLAEKAYEAFVCADLDVHLPAALENNPIVKEGTRCPWCQSWTYVRAGHERRCPRRAAATTGNGGAMAAATVTDEWTLPPAPSSAAESPTEPPAVPAPPTEAAEPEAAEPEVDQPAADQSEVAEPEAAEPEAAEPEAAEPEAAEPEVAFGYEPSVSASPFPLDEPESEEPS